MKSFYIRWLYTLFSLVNLFFWQKFLLIQLFKWHSLGHKAILKGAASTKGTKMDQGLKIFTLLNLCIMGMTLIFKIGTYCICSVF